MKTTSLPFTLRLPVVVAPMFLISGPDLVLAACRAGVVGSFPTPNARTPEVLAHWMQQITQGLEVARDQQDPATVGPWCANLVTHSSNTRLKDDLALVAQYKPPIVVTALGSPKPALDLVQGYGGRVLADVTNLKLAEKAAAAGVDGLACVSAGAGGHTGFLSPFAFVSAVRQFFNGVVAVGGGISDGYGVAGAIACGADLVYMGTRFIPVDESMAPQAYKQMVVDSNVDDLIISAGVSGTPASWLKPSLRANGFDPDNMPDAPGRQYDSSQVITGKKWAEVWAAGQGLGSIRAVEPVAQVVSQLQDEYQHAVRRLVGIGAATGAMSQQGVLHG